MKEVQRFLNRAETQDYVGSFLFLHEHLLLHKGYHTVARKYEFYVRMARRNVCSFYYIDILITAFLTIFRRFPTTFRRSPKILQNLSEGYTNVAEHFQRKLEIAEDSEENPKMF